MAAERCYPTFPTDDMDRTVALLSAVFGCAPTFVDGQRWAQFDINGSRVSLAGTDRAGDGPSLAVKVNDLDAMSVRLREAGIDVGAPVTGPHERRAVIRPDHTLPWTVVLYQPA